MGVMVRCSCGNVLASVEAICEVCLPNGVVRSSALRPRFALAAECMRCGDELLQPRAGRSTVTCASCGTTYGLDFFRLA